MTSKTSEDEFVTVEMNFENSESFDSNEGTILDKLENQKIRYIEINLHRFVWDKSRESELYFKSNFTL